MSPLLLLGAVLASAGPPPSLDRPGDVMPDRHWDVLHLDLALRIDPSERAVSGVATHVVAPLGRPRSRLRLHQLGLAIDAVHVDGHAVEGWRLDDGHLDIPMPVDGRTHEVAVRYRATPEIGLHFRGPPDDRIVEVWSQGQESDNRAWFPTWDYPNDKFTYTASLTAPAAHVALTNGTLSSREEAESGWTTWRYAFDAPIPAYLVAIAVGDYIVFLDEADGVPLEYVVPAWASEALARATLGESADVMAFFGELLALPFPWPIYRQVFVQRFLYGAMENTTLTIHEGDLLRPLDDPYAWFTEEVIAHELAHQWFGDLVTCDGWRELWLNESFAAYYAGLWQRERRGEASFATKLRAWHASAYYDDRPLAPRAWSEPAERAGIHTIYARGAIALHGLRAMLGPEVFDAGIARYLAAHHGGLVETADLRKALQAVSGTHLGWWFDAFVHSGHVPAWRTSWRWADGTLTVEIVQDADAPPVEVPVTVAIGGDGPEVRHTAWTGPGTTRVEVQRADAPTWVSIDPDGVLPATWTHDQSPEAWVAQLATASAPYARLVAMDHLVDGRGGAAAIAALDGVLLEAELPPAYRAHAVTTLGAIGASEAVEALERALGATAPRIRETAASALGEVPASPTILRALESAALRDDAPAVRGAALGALAKHDAERALPIARRLLASPREAAGPWEVRAAAHVIGRHGTASDLRRLTVASRASLSYTARAALLDQLVALVARVDEGPRRDRAREEVARALEARLRDADHRIRLLAIARLGRIGDEASVRHLRALAAETTVPAIATAARDAAAKIRTSGRAKPEPDAPKPDDEAVEERLKALEERLKRLETWRY